MIISTIDFAKILYQIVQKTIKHCTNSSKYSYFIGEYCNLELELLEKSSDLPLKVIAAYQNFYWNRKNVHSNDIMIVNLLNNLSYDEISIINTLNVL